MPFIHKDFLLTNKHSRYLYERYAAAEPILDYHCHLPPADVAANRQFRNLFEIWLEGDHYKWRAMRANGVDERFCTGDASPYEKFLAWARTVPMTLRNPLYHWTHLELLRYFEIDEPLDENTASRIWEWANEQLATDDLRAHGILDKFSVRAVCTTDDPADDLAHHKAIAASGIATRVFPTFRPDRAMAVHTPDAFAQWIARLEAVSNRSVGNFASFLDALKSRHDFFHQMGGRLSDHGINHVFADFPPESEAAAIYDRARAGQAASPAEYARFTRGRELQNHRGRGSKLRPRIDPPGKQLADVKREGRDEIAATLERRTGPCALPSMMGTQHPMRRIRCAMRCRYPRRSTPAGLFR